jgi:hypothetical protein
MAGEKLEHRTWVWRRILGDLGLSKVFTIKADTLTPGIAKYLKKAGVGKHDSDTAYFKAQQVVGLQLLNFTLNGSSNESVVPPIKWGVLRGSGSVFVEGVLVGDTKANYPDGTPNIAYDGEGVVIGFNTSYAARLHETKWVPGGVIPSKQATNNPGLIADVGNKFVEKHLKADGKVLLDLFADTFKTESEKL